MKPSKRLDLNSAAWRKSSYSDELGSDCVEVADNFPGVIPVIPVRDSKNPQGPAVVFPAGAWAAFLSGLKE
ncbi:DUF397 domain-containing protein [Streptomyces sp. NBC_01485]|uniref:DUF397 domain-containing protein n=1 Tax=Streptomyces sp. NBC_01485 TaxID=2903884 RepID=UPI002E31A365|nr:DUF397 domain-containing protein [Streptomyces sp. NBC_01485]